MAIYEIELENGEKYQVETEESSLAQTEKSTQQTQAEQTSQEPEQASNVLTHPFKTVMGSGANLLGGALESVLHPVRTAKGMVGLNWGLMEKLIPGEQPQEKYVDAVADMYKQRYGGVENIKKTILEDPVGFAADLSTFLGGAGGALKQLGKAGNIGKLSTTGNLLSKTGRIVDPFRAAGSIVEQPLKAVSSKFAEGAKASYTKALGATSQTEKALAAKVAPELAKRKPFVFTRTGLERATEKRLTRAGEALEKGYNALGEDAKVAVNPILENIAKKQDSLKINGVIPDESKIFHSKLNEVADSIINIAKTDDVPLKTIRTYRQLLDETVMSGKKIFPTALGNAKREAQRIAANAIRGEIAKQYPSIERLNAEFAFQKKLSNILETTVPKTKSPLSQVGGVVGQISGMQATGVTIGNLGKLFSDNVAWNTLSGSTKARIAELLIKGDMKNANSVILNALKGLGKAGEKVEETTGGTNE